MHAFYRRPVSANTRLLDAAWMGDLDTLKWALERGANPNVRDRHQATQGQTPLHRMLSNSGVDAEALEAGLRGLLDAGANPNLVDGRGQTPADLLFEVGSAHTLDRVLPLLLERGMGLHGGPGSAESVPSPVFQCMRALKHPERLDRVLAHGGRLDQRNRDQDTPLLALTRAIHMGMVLPERVLTVLDRGADVNAVSGLDGASALTLLALNLEYVPACAPVMAQLLDRGADPSHAQRLMVPGSVGGRLTHLGPDKDHLNRPMADGYTALHLAAWYGSMDACRTLVAHGAVVVQRTGARGVPCQKGTFDRFVEPGEGFTARDLAQRAGHTAVASMLEGAELAAELRANDLRADPARPRSRL